MNTRRTLAVSRRVLRGLRHDRRSMGLILVAPIMAMFVFGIAFSGEVSDVPVALVNFDTPVTLPNGTQVSLGDSIVAHLDRDLMRLNELEPTEGAAEEAVHMANAARPARPSSSPATSRATPSCPFPIPATAATQPFCCALTAAT